MPNWCEQDLYIEGKPESVKAFIKAIDNGRKLNCERFKPYPKKYRKLDDNSKDWKGFNSGGQEWCVRNWGSNWDIKDIRILGEEFIILGTEVDKPLIPIINAYI